MILSVTKSSHPIEFLNSLRSHFAKSKKKGMSTTGAVSKETFCDDKQGTRSKD